MEPALSTLLSQPNAWTWAIGALLLAALEILLPGTFMIWLAAAALATAGLTALFSFGAPVQAGVFAVLSVISVIAGRRYFSRHPIVSDDAGLNRRADRLIGETVVVVEAIVNGHGKVQVDDSPWMARGSDMPAGARVRIVRAEGTVLHVEPA